MLRKKDWLQYVTVSASQIQPNGIKCCSTLVWSTRSMEYLHIDPIYTTHWSLSVLPWNRNGTTLLRMGKSLVMVRQTKQEWIECPKLMAKQPERHPLASKCPQHKPHDMRNTYWFLTRMWPGTGFKPFAGPYGRTAPEFLLIWDAGRAKCSAVRTWPHQKCVKVDDLNHTRPMQKTHASVNTHCIYITLNKPNSNAAWHRGQKPPGTTKGLVNFSRATGSTIAAGRFGLGVWLWMLPWSKWTNWVGLYGCFQIIHFNRVFNYKPSILGYQYFWKHPNVAMLTDSALLQVEIDEFTRVTRIHQWYRSRIN